MEREGELVSTYSCTNYILRSQSNRTLFESLGYNNKQVLVNRRRVSAIHDVNLSNGSIIKRIVEVETSDCPVSILCG
jgi:hypothetical protein